ncbi:unnamed protein product [Didymodactylos carnosus]|uniref:Uncharacterized protein n=1 Tax=Didymodactylos carnosus TaxID=1234261 RepID=A0A8S2FUW1_9BILA|nr:unnamed protein product [Didymodactylos carnosus]CAF4356803.1 unnamed protein product [Didymodactylos carnosus]
MDRYDAPAAPSDDGDAIQLSFNTSTKNNDPKLESDVQIQQLAIACAAAVTPVMKIDLNVDTTKEYNSNYIVVRIK